ncbi:MAG: 2-aminoethylphosphonate--pyruvate transaminase [Balneolaceae bacterium]|nr:MAG: 2-aminoethylphosphonate--pyruvate transaminase [Balneolaceae bacterium]
MSTDLYPDNPYLLLTPGPLSTSKTVKAAMLRDWCTWDDDYNSIVQEIRKEIVSLAVKTVENYTAVLMQGSGTFSVEATIGSVVPPDGKLLVLANGAYGNRIATIASYLKMNLAVLDWGDTGPVNLDDLENILNQDKEITHVAVVHTETTTGMLNPAESIARVVKKHNKIFILDAMSSFGGIPLDMEKLGIDYLVSSANKCIQGVPGFGFVIARRSEIENVKGYARSLSLDLYSQWKTMEDQHGKWRFTSATHVVRAFRQALIELQEEGGIEARYRRYHENQAVLVKGMKELGFKPLLPDEQHSPIITTFLSPDSESYEFKRFYDELKKHGFVIYPGKVTSYDCFRIGNIGEVYRQDIDRLLAAIQESMYWNI